MKTRQVKRDWSKAVEKVQAEGMCRYCGLSQDLEAAHIIGRQHDPIEVGPRGGEARVVLPESIVVLCSFHHQLYDARQLDLLPFLYVDEQAHAVKVAGGIANALRRITGSRDA